MHVGKGGLTSYIRGAYSEAMSAEDVSENIKAKLDKVTAYTEYEKKLDYFRRGRFSES